MTLTTSKAHHHLRHHSRWDEPLHRVNTTDDPAKYFAHELTKRRILAIVPATSDAK